MTMKTSLGFGLLLGAAAFANAQDVSTINSVRTFREFTGDTTATFTEVNNYPSLVSFSEQSVDGNGTAGGANRDVFKFSADSGASNFVFGVNTFFSVDMAITLSLPAGVPNAPRKEAGYLFDSNGGQGLFIITSDGEVAAFGGGLPFFRAAGTYTPGQTVNLGLTVFRDTDNLRKIQYRFNGETSAALAFDNLEQGLPPSATLGGYLQVPVDATNPSNGATATFANIAVRPVNPVPEPATMAALGLGALALLKRRRSAK